MSFADLQRLPEDGRRFELYDGEVCELSAPMPRHQVAVSNIKRLLEAYAARHGGLSLISPIDIVFSDYNVVQPDVVFFTQARRHLVDFDAPTRSAPDLAVEILSPSTRANDRGRKMAMFARFGVQEYWIADPAAACIEVYQLQDTAYRVAAAACDNDVVPSPMLAGFEFLASDAFRLP